MPQSVEERSNHSAARLSDPRLLQNCSRAAGVWQKEQRVCKESYTGYGSASESLADRRSWWQNNTIRVQVPTRREEQIISSALTQHVFWQICHPWVGTVTPNLSVTLCIVGGFLSLFRGLGLLKGHMIVTMTRHVQGQFPPTQDA